MFALDVNNQRTSSPVRWMLGATHLGTNGKSEDSSEALTHSTDAHAAAFVEHSFRWPWSGRVQEALDSVRTSGDGQSQMAQQHDAGDRKIPSWRRTIKAPLGSISSTGSRGPSLWDFADASAKADPGDAASAALGVGPVTLTPSPDTSKALLPPVEEVKAAIANAHTAVEAARGIVQQTDASTLRRSLRSVNRSVETLRDDVRDATRKVNTHRGGSLFGGAKGAPALGPPWLLRAPKPGLHGTVRVGAAARKRATVEGVLNALRPGRSGSDSVSPDSGSRPSYRGNQSLASRMLSPVTPLLKDALIQPLVHCSAGATLGRFRKWTLDHTSLTAAVDVAVRRDAPYMQARNGSGNGGDASGGVVHHAKLSVRQQLLGPVRARLDMRWELDAKADNPDRQRHVPTAAFMNDTLCHVRNLRAVPVDMTVGADVSLFVLRGCAWFSVPKKRGMFEIRL